MFVLFLSEENVYHFLPVLLKFTIVCSSQKLDGFLIELPGDIFGSSVEVCLFKQNNIHVGICNN